jgi:hypothetical protein
MLVWRDVEHDCCVAGGRKAKILEITADNNGAVKIVTCTTEQDKLTAKFIL